MPANAQWDVSYSVGNDLLDRQHQKLLALCNQLARCVEGDPHTALSQFHQILHELTEYAQQHFRLEESMLQKLHYPHLDAQRAEHGAYEERMAEWAFSTTMDTFDMDEAQQFLTYWWRDHILVSDMQYKPFMEGKR